MKRTCVLFGDGAGAVLVEATEEENVGVQNSYLRTYIGPMQNTWAWDWEPAPLLAEAGLKTQAECMSI